jgi:hypothetical protein
MPLYYIQQEITPPTVLMSYHGQFQTTRHTALLSLTHPKFMCVHVTTTKCRQVNHFGATPQGWEMLQMPCTKQPSTTIC